VAKKTEKFHHCNKQGIATQDRRKAVITPQNARLDAIHDVIFGNAGRH
jgi:hypothetical protein